MGLDIFLHCRGNGEPATFKRAIAEEILSRGAIDYGPPLTYVSYADGSKVQIYLDDIADIPLGIRESPVTQASAGQQRDLLVPEQALERVW
jgi:hypothetical protein